MAADRVARSGNALGVPDNAEWPNRESPRDCWFRGRLMLFARGYLVLGIDFLTRRSGLERVHDGEPVWTRVEVLKCGH